MIDAAHHLAARAVILGGAERVARALRIEAQDARADRRAAERVPGAGGVIVARGRVQRHAGAGRDLVAHHEGRDERAPVGHLVLVGEGKERRQQRHAGMALGEPVAVMGIERVDGRGTRIGRAGHADAAPVEHQPCAGAAHLARREVMHDAREPGLPAAHRDADQVEQAALRLRDHVRRQVRKAQRMDEREWVDHGRRSASTRASSAWISSGSASRIVGSRARAAAMSA
jgi:hypothetical protein